MSSIAEKVACGERPVGASKLLPFAAPGWPPSSFNSHLPKFRAQASQDINDMEPSSITWKEGKVHRIKSRLMCLMPKSLQRWAK
jgi:hypothetical protein